MRESFDLAFANASILMGDRPKFQHSSTIAFLRPVPIGSILDFHSRAIHSTAKAVTIAVSADVINQDTRKRETASTFHYTFGSSLCDKGERRVPAIVPRTYADMLRMIGTMRRDRLAT